MKAKKPEAPSTPAAERVVLFFQSGSSDKEYHADLVEKDDGWVVNYRYGKRGSALKSGTKTAAPLAFEEAWQVYYKVVQGQLRDGYTPKEGGVAYQDTDRAALFTGIVPQLLNSVSEKDLQACLLDPSRLMQEKHDGERRLIRREGDVVTGINRKGLSVALPKPFEAAALGLPATQFILDGEDLGDKLVVFDLLELDGVDWRPRPYRERLNKLENLIRHADPAFRAVETAYTHGEKRDLREKVRQALGEGVVYKTSSAPYVAGRPASGGDQCKEKFTAGATVRVAATHKSRRSVSMEVFDADQAPVAVGNVTIPVNHAVPEVGAIVEVEYLYAYKDGSLFQPVYKGPRGDQGLEDCLQSQLKYKAGTVDLASAESGDDEVEPVAEEAMEASAKKRTRKAL